MIPNLDTPGNHPFFFEGKIGRLQAEMTVPEKLSSDYVAFLGHPHSLQGGSMTNKVVTTLARAFANLGIPSLRFNFRGVGDSEGQYDAGIGESEDMLALVKLWQKQHPNTRLVFAGFSFGSYVACRAANQSKTALLISIAPPVHHYDYDEFSNLSDRWVIFQGESDEVVPLDLVLAFADKYHPPLPVIRFPDTGHFFHGKLLQLRDDVSSLIQQTL